MCGERVSRATGYQRQCVTEKGREREGEGQSVHCGVQTILLSWSSSEVATKRRQTANRERLGKGKGEKGHTEGNREREGEKGTVTQEGREVGSTLAHD